MLADMSMLFDRMEEQVSHLSARYVLQGESVMEVNLGIDAVNTRIERVERQIDEMPERLVPFMDLTNVDLTGQENIAPPVYDFPGAGR